MLCSLFQLFSENKIRLAVSVVRRCCGREAEKRVGMVMIGIVETEGESEKRRQQGEKGTTDQRQEMGSEQKDAETLGGWEMGKIQETAGTRS